MEGDNGERLSGKLWRPAETAYVQQESSVGGCGGDRSGFGFGSGYCR